MASLAPALFQPDTARPGKTPAPENAAGFVIWPSDGTVISGGKFWYGDLNNFS